MIPEGFQGLYPLGGGEKQTGNLFIFFSTLFRPTWRGREVSLLKKGVKAGLVFQMKYLKDGLRGSEEGTHEQGTVGPTQESPKDRRNQGKEVKGQGFC